MSLLRFLNVEFLCQLWTAVFWSVKQNKSRLASCVILFVATPLSEMTSETTASSISDMISFSVFLILSCWISVALDPFTAASFSGSLALPASGTACGVSVGSKLPPTVSCCEDAECWNSCQIRRKQKLMTIENTSLRMHCRCVHSSKSFITFLRNRTSPWQYFGWTLCLHFQWKS